MKRTIKSLVFGKSVGVTLVIAAAILFTAAFACESGGDKVPPDNELQSMVKETTADFANAIDTEDFSKLHSKASQDFQETYAVDQTKAAFSSFIDKKDVILPSLKNAAGTTATFSTPPAIRQEKGLNILVTKGEFPSKPFPVKFECEYVWRDGGFKMLKLVINM